jgi:hypothetical protein
MTDMFAAIKAKRLFGLDLGDWSLFLVCGLLLIGILLLVT